MTSPDEALRAEISRLRKIAAKLAVYREISQRALAATTTAEVGAIAASAMREMFGSEGGAVLVAPDPEEAAAPSRHYGAPAALWGRIPEAAREGILAASLRERKPLTETDAGAFLEREGLPPAPALSSLMVLPMLDGSACLGALVALNLSFPANMDRYVEDALGITRPICHALAHVRLLERLLEAERARADIAEILATEIDHRMKNNLAMVAGLLQMQLVGQPLDSAAADLVRQALARIQTIGEVHAQLHERRSGTLDILEAMRRIAEIARGALSRDVAISVEGDPFICQGGVATSFCVSANELVTNAIKHGAPGPDGVLSIKISVTRQNGRLTLSVWNSGSPIQSGLEENALQTTGLRLVQEIAARQYKGAFAMGPHRGGTLARIEIPEDALCGQETARR
jgi:two-component sensor histidine kinase